MYEPVAIPVQATMADVDCIAIYEDDENDLMELPAVRLPCSHSDYGKDEETKPETLSLASIVTSIPTTSQDQTPEQLVVAQQVMPTTRTTNQKYPFSLVEQIEYYETVRAEYISSSFLPGDDLGIQLGHGKSYRTIVDIRQDSPASKSPLRVGDELISVNGRSCAHMTEPELFVALLEDAVLTLVAHNQGGATDIVESMITKKQAADKIGMGIKKEFEALIIGSLNYEMAAGKHTLLNPEDQLLAINGISTAHLNKLEAVGVIGAALDTVTIRARIGSTSQALVVGEVVEPAKVAAPATAWCSFGLNFFGHSHAQQPTNTVAQMQREAMIRSSLSAQAA